MARGDDWLVRGFGTVYPVHVEAFVRLMTTLRRAFDGDLDLMLILAVIGERKLARRVAPDAVTLERFGATDIAEPDSVAANPHSIAAFTGIPRETVRRKVATLIERGWVERDGNGDLRPTRRAAVELAEGTEATMRYLRAVIDAADRARRAACPE
jgi:DNA-binding MarR family transcriptional regulator